MLAKGVVRMSLAKSRLGAVEASVLGTSRREEQGGLRGAAGQARQLLWPWKLADRENLCAGVSPDCSGPKVPRQSQCSHRLWGWPQATGRHRHSYLISQDIPRS